jgi:hypothetical protein
MGLIGRLLRGMPTDRLAAIHPHDFQRWPAREVVPGKIIAELISNEKARRK